MEILGKGKEVAEVRSNVEHGESKSNWTESTRPWREIEIRMGDGKTVRKIVPVLKNNINVNLFRVK